MKKIWFDNIACYAIDFLYNLINKTSDSERREKAQVISSTIREGIGDTSLLFAPLNPKSSIKVTYNNSEILNEYLSCFFYLNKRFYLSECEASLILLSIAPYINNGIKDLYMLLSGEEYLCLELAMVAFEENDFDSKEVRQAYRVWGNNIIWLSKTEKGMTFGKKLLKLTPYAQEYLIHNNIDSWLDSRFIKDIFKIYTPDNYINDDYSKEICERIGETISLALSMKDVKDICIYGQAGIGKETSLRHILNKKGLTAGWLELTEASIGEVNELCNNHGEILFWSGLYADVMVLHINILDASKLKGLIRKIEGFVDKIIILTDITEDETVDIDRENERDIIRDKSKIGLIGAFKRSVPDNSYVIDIDRYKILGQMDIQLQIWSYFLDRMLGNDAEEKYSYLKYKQQFLEYAINYDFTIKQIKNAVWQFSLSLNKIYLSNLQINGNLDREAEELLIKSEIKKACQNQLYHKLGKVATRISSDSDNKTIDDIVISEDKKSILYNIHNRIKLNKYVYNKYSIGREAGDDAAGYMTSVLFYGAPGTGKTMAAGVLASMLGMEIYKVNLATVVSKYIGETEKNLSIIFEEAKKSQAILFFDEADVLFSKRTEVKESNDKYSNMEAAYMLQKMDEYKGIVILATNYQQNIDEAFKRRLTFILEFSYPDKVMRRVLWDKMFANISNNKSEGCSLISDDIDFDFISEAFEMTGSNIKNAAINAAFLATAEQEMISMRHILKAVVDELGKYGKKVTKNELSVYADLIDS